MCALITDAERPVEIRPAPAAQMGQNTIHNLCRFLQQAGLNQEQLAQVGGLLGQLVPIVALLLCLPRPRRNSQAWPHNCSHLQANHFAIPKLWLPLSDKTERLWQNANCPPRTGETDTHLHNKWNHEMPPAPRAQRPQKQDLQHCICKNSTAAGSLANDAHGFATANKFRSRPSAIHHGGHRTGCACATELSLDAQNTKRAAVMQESTSSAPQLYSPPLLLQVAFGYGSRVFWPPSHAVSFGGFYSSKCPALLHGFSVFAVFLLLLLLLLLLVRRWFGICAFLFVCVERSQLSEGFWLKTPRSSINPLFGAY